MSIWWPDPTGVNQGYTRREIKAMRVYRRPSHVSGRFDALKVALGAPFAAPPTKPWLRDERRERRERRMKLRKLRGWR